MTERDPRPALIIFGHFSPQTYFMQFNRDVARAIAADGWDVLWVSPPGGIRAAPLAWLLSFRRGRLTREGQLWHFRPWAIPGRRFPPFGARALKAARRQLERAIHEVKMDAPAIMFYLPDDWPLIEEISHGRTGYWVGDIALNQLDTYAGLRDFLVAVDVVLPISPQACDDARALGLREIVPLATGVTLARFEQPTTPADLKDIPRPIAGYVGGMGADRFDVALVMAAARELPDVSFVLVGPSDAAVDRSLRRDAPHNIHYLGMRSYEEVSDYMCAFDVGLVPYLVNDFNTGSNPLKVYEYFAAGIPVVTTALRSVEERGELVYVARTPAEFSGAIRSALAERDPQRAESRKAIAEQHSTERIASLVEAALSSKVGPLPLPSDGGPE